MSRQSAINAAEKSKKSDIAAEGKKEVKPPEAVVDDISEASSAEEIQEDAQPTGGGESDHTEETEDVDNLDESDADLAASAGEDTDANGSKGASSAPEEGDEEAEEESEEERHQAEINELNDKYIRLAAEFENFKKRTNQEMQSRFKYASQPLAQAIISGLDSLERATNQAEQAIEEKDLDHFKEFVAGIDMAKQQFYDAFKNNNIERTSPKGDLFDPNIHEAMGVIESDEVETDHIAEVFQAGYYLFDRVIRPAMVQVAKNK